MSRTPFTSSLLDVPRPLIDPIDTFEEALGIVSLGARHPLANESIVLPLDRHNRGVGLIRVVAPEERLAHDIASVCVRTPLAAAAFVVTFRRTCPVGPRDAALFDQISAVLASNGHSLVDWVVVGRGGFYCPRVLTDAPDPWCRA